VRGDGIGNLLRGFYDGWIAINSTVKITSCAGKIRGSLTNENFCIVTRSEEHI
jgi:hypothetical protein